MVWSTRQQQGCQFRFYYIQSKRRDYYQRPFAQLFVRPFVRLNRQKRSLTRVDLPHQRAPSLHRCHQWAKKSSTALLTAGIVTMPFDQSPPCWNPHGRLGTSCAGVQMTSRDVAELQQMLLPNRFGKSKCNLQSCGAIATDEQSRMAHAPVSNSKNIFSRMTCFHLEWGWFQCNAWCKNLH